MTNRDREEKINLGERPEGEFKCRWAVREKGSAEELRGGDGTLSREQALHDKCDISVDFRELPVQPAVRGATRPPFKWL